ncbi:MAG: corrinoid protein [Candidatus Bathyarchaeia archaeon]|jgi:5-methyltetrahydrofolate--homocysteine methyltransferase
MSSKSDVIENLRKAVLDLDADRVRAAAEDAVKLGVDPIQAIDDGLARGVRTIGDRFAAGEAFLTELVMAGEAMKAGVEVLRPIILQRKLQRKSAGVVVIGTVRGDIHDIGKNIVAVMLESADFEVNDLGADVPPEKFVDKTKESKAQIVAMSALLTVTTPEQKNTIDAISKAGIRKNVKVAVGGAAVTPEWAREIGAEGYSDNAVDAVELFKKLVRS